MKKFAFIAITIVLFCLTALTACNIETDKLSEPINLRYERAKQDIVWDEVPYATGGYLIEINGEETVVGRNYWYSLSNLVTGTYTIRVKALTIDFSYFKDSDWSKPYTHVVRKESGVTYRLINDGSEYEVESIGSASGVVHIFDTYIDGIPITSVGDSAFANTSTITSVFLGENITNIADSAFFGCAALKTVSLPEGILFIGSYAFSGCKILSEINLPDSILTFGEGVFSDCVYLKTVVIPNKVSAIPNSMFSQCSGLANLTIGSTVHSIGKFAFSGCQSLAKLTIPGNVEIISEYAFMTSGIIELEMEEGVAYIDQYAFRYASNLKKVKIPSTVIKVGYSAFAGTSLWENPDEYADPEYPSLIYADNWVVGFIDDYNVVDFVELKAGTVGIGDYTFFDFESLADIEIPSTIMHIGTYAFNNTGIWNNSTRDVVTVGHRTTALWVVGCKDPENITAVSLDLDTVGIASHSFVAATKLSTVTGTGSLKTIGEFAFYYCVELTFNIASTVQYIGDYAFHSCIKIGAQTIPEGIKRIGDYTFYYCSNLTDISLPQSLKSVGQRAFRFTELNSLTLPEGLTYLGDAAFSVIYERSGSPKLDIVVPEGVKYLGEEAFAWSSKINSITLKGVEYIGYRAFYRCYSLTTINLYDGLVYIGAEAFSSTGLKSIVIPDTVVYMGDGVFAGEFDRFEMVLKSVTLSNNLKRIGRSAFFLCLELTSINIPASVRSIGDYAFLECPSLTSILIGKNVGGMGYSVFFGCNNLTIYCETTVRPDSWSLYWNSRDYITVEDYNNPPDDYTPTGLGDKDHPMSPIVWGCVLSEDKTYVVSLTKHEYSIYNFNGVTMYAPYRNGYSFSGWSLTEGSTRVDYNIRAMQLNVTAGGPQLGATLYAVWA